MKRFIYTFILCLCAVIVSGQRRTNPNGQIGEIQHVHGGTQVIYIQPEKEKELDTVKVKPKKEKVKLVKDTVKKQPKAPKVKKELPTPFIGTSLGIGFDYYQDVATRLKGNWSLDMAFYCTEKFALGGYLKYHSISQISGGFLFVHNFKNPNIAFLWGVGVDVSCAMSQLGEGVHPVLPYAEYEIWNDWNCGAEIRLGCQFNKNWYMWFDMSHKDSYGESNTYYNYGSYNNEFLLGDNSKTHLYTYALSASISIGYKFNIKKKNKK